jgi:hypothetical protein
MALDYDNIKYIRTPVYSITSGIAHSPSFITKDSSMDLTNPSSVKSLYSSRQDSPFYNSKVMGPNIMPDNFNNPIEERDRYSAMVKLLNTKNLYSSLEDHPFYESDVSAPYPIPNDNPILTSTNQRKMLTGLSSQSNVKDTLVDTMINQPMINQPMINQPMINQPMINQPMITTFKKDEEKDNNLIILIVVFLLFIIFMSKTK